jgi:cystathionine beta-lyase/cystathionine gamma-synthase
MNKTDILTHLGEDREKYFNAIAPPIIQTSNFKFDTMADLKKAFEYERGSHLYTRGNNPTVTMCATKIAALEGSEAALLVGSGAAAISNSVLANVQAGDHIICVQNAYSWANKLMENFLPRFNVQTTFVNGSDVANFENAIQENTKIFFLESPTSLMMEMQDLKAIVKLATEVSGQVKANKIITILDNSYGSPLNNNPIKWGIDIVFHSATKYIGGHSDVVAGVICSSKAMIDKIFQSEMMTLGNILAPQDAWLLMRGLRTLPIRVKEAAKTTKKVIKFLEKHPKVEKILYPHHKSNPQIKLARKQMPQEMSLFSVVFKTDDMAKLEKFVDDLNYFLIAVSWGGYESLALPIQTKYQDGIAQIVRFYIGLEASKVLISDIEQALDKMEI